MKLYDSKLKKRSLCLPLLALAATLLSSCENTSKRTEIICPAPQWPSKCANDFIQSAPESQCFDDWIDKIARQQSLLDDLDKSQK